MIDFKKNIKNLEKKILSATITKKFTKMVAGLHGCAGCVNISQSLNDFFKQINVLFGWLSTKFRLNNYGRILLVSGGVILVLIHCSIPPLPVFEINQFLLHLLSVPTVDNAKSSALFDPVEPGDEKPTESKTLSFLTSVFTRVVHRLVCYGIGLALVYFVFSPSGPSRPPSTPPAEPATPPADVAQALVLPARNSFSRPASVPSISNPNLLAEAPSNSLTQVIGTPAPNSFSASESKTTGSHFDWVSFKAQYGEFLTSLTDKAKPRWVRAIDSAIANDKGLGNLSNNVVESSQQTATSLDAVVINKPLRARPPLSGSGLDTIGPDWVPPSLSTREACNKYIDTLLSYHELATREEQEVIFKEILRVQKHRAKFGNRKLYDPIEVDVWNWLDNVEDQTWVLLTVLLIIIILFSFIRYSRRHEKPAR